VKGEGLCDGIAAHQLAISSFEYIMTTDVTREVWSRAAGHPGIVAAVEVLPALVQILAH
jgi:hypothetical protein